MGFYEKFLSSSKQRKQDKKNKNTKEYEGTNKGKGRSLLHITSSSVRSSDLPPAYSETVTVESPLDESQYDFLGVFDTIFLVDDSSSMRIDGRWAEAGKAIAAIAPICTKYDQDGIDIYFLNHKKGNHTSRGLRAGGYQNVTTKEEVEKIFRDVAPNGQTWVGTRLNDILEPYIHRVKLMHEMKKSNGSFSFNMDVKPINIITITDGRFTDEAEGIIMQTAKTLDACSAIPWQVGIQFFQVGNDPKATSYLVQLDNELSEMGQSEKVRDIVDTVIWKKNGVSLNSEGILKTVLGAVNKKWDRTEV
ncbi:uncharacterized protein N7529_005002 [Penicillium soppii]|jgi:hypothetical protein|uniref:uncharacterized protein n=1 Tax=Penicillium soppii TaxID=69789 RepID=UPI0025493E09|nr:uncharacterized protein N7529_005002 [Penicillium soppii]KAJ5872649.1 hypothetical protein N7529_005002 [Penicillium soppii]